MKKILSLVILPIVLFCGFSVSLSAQAGSVLTLDEGSFRLEQTNALGGVNIDPIGKDRSNRACFRLKLHLDFTPKNIRRVSTGETVPFACEKGATSFDIEKLEDGEFFWIE